MVTLGRGMVTRGVSGVLVIIFLSEYWLLGYVQIVKIKLYIYEQFSVCIFCQKFRIFK